MSNTAFLEELEALIRSRITDGAGNSYTASLVSKGVTAVAQKVGEEGVELALAAVAESDIDVTNEAADLLYHTLVLLAARDISLGSVIATLEDRHRARQVR